LTREWRELSIVGERAHCQSPQSALTIENHRVSSRRGAPSEMENMEKDENIPAGEKRRLQAYVDGEDALARLLGVPEADYECVTVNSSWPDKGLIEGDVILVTASDVARGGDIVLIEEDGHVRLGLISEPGWLETAYGTRPLNATEHIVGVGLALARRLHKN